MTPCVETVKDSMFISLICCFSSHIMHFFENHLMKFSVAENQHGSDFVASFHIKVLKCQRWFQNLNIGGVKIKLKILTPPILRFYNHLDLLGKDSLYPITFYRTCIEW